MEEHDIHSRFEVEKCLAKGIYTTVSLVREKKSGQEYALKALHIEDYPGTSIDRLMWEVTFHDRVSHPNIIKKLESFKIGNTVYVLMEYAEKGDLFGFFWKHRSSFNEAMIRRILFQVANGVNAIHQAGLLHRDLKPENILLDHDLNVKLCDFGWSCEIGDENTNCEKAGTLAFMSPEALEGKKQGKWSDVWSFGMLLYEMYHGSEAFEGENKESRLKSILTTEVVFDNSYPKDIADLFSKCNQICPENRIPFCEISSHQAFLQFNSVPSEVESTEIREKSLSATKKYAPLLSSSHLRRRTADSGNSIERKAKESTPIKAKPISFASQISISKTTNQGSSGFLKSSVLKRACSPVFKPVSHGPKPIIYSEKNSTENNSFHLPWKISQPQESSIYQKSSPFIQKESEEQSLEIQMTGLAQSRPESTLNEATGAYDPLRMLSNFSVTMNNHYPLLDRARQELHQHKAVRVLASSIDTIKEKTKPKSISTFMTNLMHEMKKNDLAAADSSQSNAVLVSIYSPSNPVLQSYQSSDLRTLDHIKQPTVQEAAHYRKLSGRLHKDHTASYRSEKNINWSGPIQFDQWSRTNVQKQPKVGANRKPLCHIKRELSESLTIMRSQVTPGVCSKPKFSLPETKRGVEDFKVKGRLLKKPLPVSRTEPKPQSEQPTIDSCGKKTEPVYSSLLKLSARNRESSSKKYSIFPAEQNPAHRPTKPAAQRRERAPAAEP